MNISSLHISKVFLYLIFLASPLWIGAQVVHIDLLVNETANYEFTSDGNPSEIEQAPSNGTYYINGFENSPGTSGLNDLEYEPDQDYLGNDTMIITYWENPGAGPQQKILTLIFTVSPGYVIAHPDYALTEPDLAVVIDVIENDESNGNLVLTDIPLTNHGTPEITSPTEITFTPAAGFQGIAQFNYTVCEDANGICDVGIVTVFVQDNIAANDTLTLVTLKNQPIKALMPTDNGVQELEGASNGTLELLDGGVEYTPDNDFVGLDSFSYAYNTNGTTSIATFIIDVLWAPDPNDFAINDFSFTAVDHDISIDVLNNDIGNNLVIMDYDQISQNGGLVDKVNGELVYSPFPGFEGLDMFEYSSGVPGLGNTEDATVYVVVSNQTPEAQTFELSTPVDVPLIINYDIPITNFDFVIISGASGNYGEAVFHPGEFDEEINGQNVQGYNLVIYTPEEGYAGWDEFEMNYCVGGDCQLVKIDVEMVDLPAPQGDTLCVAGCVWSGDANDDGKADMTDLLPVGYCVGEVGEERENGSVEWYGQFGDDWDGNIGSSPVNVKHVDTDGDGYISEADTVALSQFYGNYHDVTESANPPYVDIPLFFVPQTPNPQPGDLVLIDIVLGTPNLPAVDIHGLTFALNFNEEIVEPGSMNVEFFDNNWLSYNSTMLSMVKEPYLGRIEAGYTRTTGISAHGYGTIGVASFVVIDEIDGVREISDTLRMTTRVNSTFSMNSAGQYNSLTTNDFTLFIAKKVDGPFDNDERDLIVFPNPSPDVFNVHLNGNNMIEQVTLYSLTGQEVYRSGEMYAETTQVEIKENIPNGIYVLSAITESGVLNKKVEVMR